MMMDVIIDENKQLRQLIQYKVEEMKFKTRHFAEITCTSEAGALLKPRPLTLNGKSVKCWVHIFEGMDKAGMETSVRLLDKLEEFDKNAQQKIIVAYKDGDSTVCEFVDEHFNEYGEEVTEEIFGKLGINKQDDLKFLENVELGAISINHESDNALEITLDYNLIWEDGFTFTDQILAVKFDQNMKFLYLAHES